MCCKLFALGYQDYIVRRETESWREFPLAVNLLVSGEYEKYGQEKTAEFMDNLNRGGK